MDKKNNTHMFETKLNILILFWVLIYFFSFGGLEVSASQCKDCQQKYNSKDTLENNIQKKTEEFEEFEEFESSVENTTSAAFSEESVSNFDNIFAQLEFPIIGALFSIIAGIFLKYKNLRNYRKLFLFASLLLFGFYFGPCVCPVGGYQLIFLYQSDFIKYIIGISFVLLLIPITYFFGKTWCGWVCHLGGLQEFLFVKNKFKALKSNTAQKTMRILRLIFVFILSAHALLSQTKSFCYLSPFKAIFEFDISNALVGILVFLIIISSVFIYRPFCRSVCPLGLLLGLISKIPFATRIRNNYYKNKIENKKLCGSCKSCTTSCQTQAISISSSNENEKNINTFDCIACGDCLDKCKNNNITLSRKS